MNMFGAMGEPAAIAQPRTHLETVRLSSDPIVGMAVENVRRNLAALSASEVVQLVLFPEPLSAWAETVPLVA